MNEQEQARLAMLRRVIPIMVGIAIFLYLERCF
jgi:hypothetical protein